MAGLAVKTYDSDVFQNWVNTELIEGPKGINEASSVAIVDNKLSVTHNKIELEYCADKEPALFGEFYYFPIVKAAPHDIEFNGYLFMGVIPTIWHSDTKTGIAVASYYVKKDEK